MTKKKQETGITIISFSPYFRLLTNFQSALRMRPPTKTQKPFNLLLELTVSPSSSTASSIIFTRSALLAVFSRSWAISVNPAAENKGREGAKKKSSTLVLIILRGKN